MWCVAFLYLGSTLAQLRDNLFDNNFLFYRGDSPQRSLCDSSSFPEDLGQTQCFGLRHVVAYNEAQCQDACCIETNCSTWQFCPINQPCENPSVPANSCWIGTMDNCTKTQDGWVSRARTVPAPPVVRNCTSDFCRIGFNDASWLLVDTPHDWSSFDLPSQQDDSATPVWAIRQGTWLFHAGDNALWSSATFDDSDWQPVLVPSDWRLPPLNYVNTNAYGWYRRHIPVTAQLVDRANQGNLRIDLGTVASFDQTFLQGVLIGSMGSDTNVDCKDFLNYRAYPVVVGSLNNLTEVVIAVRVFSPGGNVSSGKPGGLYDSGESVSRIGPLDAAASIGQRQTGYAVGGVGWYRKHFTLQQPVTGPVAIRFDGVYMNSDMWLNEKYLGNHPYGYTTFNYDISSFLLSGENVLSVRVANTGSNSRWYSGSGIIRHVYLTQTPVVRVPLWGVYVSSFDISPTQASIRVIANVENTGFSLTSVKVQIVLYDPSGAIVAVNSSSVFEVNSNQTVNNTYIMTVKNPQLWSMDTPWLYTAQVQANDDILNTTFGVRTLSFSTTNGFQLNNKTVKLRGGCLHHDHGALGAASVDRAEERRVQLLKQLGYNAVRTSHNPASPAFLDACDRLGVLVMEEAFDCFTGGKNPDDYHVFFRTWWQRDIEAMVARDRNRPSIIMWSIGNEIPIRDTPEGISFSQQLSARVRELDPYGGRAVTSAVPGVTDQDDAFMAPLDVAGYNYSPERYESDHQRLPNRIMVATESFPADSFKYWMGVEDHSWVLGDFIWTSVDYLGESAIGSNGMYTPSLNACPGYCTTGWSYHVSYCGDIDVLGGRKPQSYYRAVLWNISQLEMAVHAPFPPNQSEVYGGWGFPDERQSWTWPSSTQPMLVTVYTRLPLVQVFVNGINVTAQPQPVSRNTEFKYTVDVPYSAGAISAVGYLETGPAVATRALFTTGAPVQIGLIPDRNVLSASRGDLAFISVRVLDSSSRLVLDGNISVSFEVSGNAEIAAAGNADPFNAAGFHSNSCVTYWGECLVILRPGSASSKPSPGKVVLSAKTDQFGLISISIAIQ